MGVEFLSMLEASFYSTFRIIFISFCGYLLVRSKVYNIILTIYNLLTVSLR